MSRLRRLLDDGKPIFGTDGVRGAAGSELTPELAMDIGQAAGAYLRNGPVLVGRDTRRSGSMLSQAIQSGFHSAGIDTVDVGVLPSGGISYLTEKSAATMGVIVSASHNPATDNGIKLLSSRGTKLADEIERELESRVRDSGSKLAVGDSIGYGLRNTEGLNEYVEYLAGLARFSMSGLRVALDCANGAAYQAAPALFERLNAEVDVHAAEPDGTNINAGCGATYPSYLAERAGGRLGFAFDGDADRLIAIDEDGRTANGDVLMAVIARYLKEQGKLKKNLIVSTVMANLGFRKSMAEADIDVVETKVGDRYVKEALDAHGGDLGGEQSGHIIFPEHSQTGDGLLTAVQVMNVIAATGRELRELRAGAIVEYPQVLENVEVDAGVDLDSATGLWDEVADVEHELGDTGRVLVRASGTEPLLRIMVEASSEIDARRYADRLAGVAKASLGMEK